MFRKSNLNNIQNVKLFFKIEEQTLKVMKRNNFNQIYHFIFRLAINLSEYILHSEILDLDSCGCSQQPTWLLVLVNISNLFLVINSSVNFIIYFSIGDTFKKMVERSNIVIVTRVKHEISGAIIVQRKEFII